MARELFSLVSVGILVSTMSASPVFASEASKVTCIAIGLPSVQGVEGSAVDVGNAVRELFSSFLGGPSINVIALDARLTSQASAEARQKDCTNVLTATVTRKRGGGGMGRLLGRAGSTMARSVPGGGATGMIARAAVLAGAEAVSELAYTTKATDELSLEFGMQTTAGGVVLKMQQENLKAGVDGEDLLTPLVRRASEVIVAATTAPR